MADFLSAVVYFATWGALLLCLPVAGMCAFVLLNEFFVEPLIGLWKRRR